ncbi:sodium:solute symporter family protein [Natrinema gelatinilyticum]|uniref:sodium:solute symporter family protein n=1 Tax=Natrinema gelatinilyticum TaxID=2961571 RepID=UPI0020C407C8|nr:sodium:solute symporter family protein [Natrinema gelatinilyticum]
MINVDLAVGVFLAYMLGMFGIGVYASRFTTHEPTDFYVAGRTLGTVVLALTLLATVLSSFTFFGVGAAASATGFGIYSFMGLGGPFYALLFILIGVKLYEIGKRRNLVTPPEYIRERYESRLASTVYVAVTGIFLVAFIATQIIGGGVAIESLMGIDYVVAISALTAFMAVYLHIAGMRGVVWSDVVQALILFGVLVGVFVYVNVTIGGNAVATSVVAENPDIFTLRGPFGVWTPTYVLTFMAVFAIGVAAYPQAIQRYFSAESAQIMKRSGILYGAIIIPVNFLAVILGIWALGFVDLEAVASPDYVIPLMIDALMHPIIFGVGMAAGVAALMSTADSQVLTIGSMLSRDIYRQYVDADISDEREVRITQVFLLVVVGLAFLLAWTRPAGIFQLGELAVAGFATTAPAVFLGIYWQRGTGVAAIVSMIIGTVTMIAFFFELIPAAWLFGMHYGFGALVLAFASYIVMSLLTPVPSEDAISNYS